MFCAWVLFAFGREFRMDYSSRSEIESRRLLQDMFTGDDLICLMHAASVGTWGIDLSSLSYLPVIQKDDLERLDEVGVRARRLWGHGSHELVQRLAEAYCQKSERVGLLRIISRLEVMPRALTIPRTLLQTERFQQEEIKQAALRLLVGQASWDAADIDILADQIASFSKGPHEFSMVIKAIEESGTRQATAEQLLLAIRHRLHASDWERTQVVLHSLNLILRRRMSTLGTSEVWRRLELPECSFAMTG